VGFSLLRFHTSRGELHLEKNNGLDFLLISINAQENVYFLSFLKLVYYIYTSVIKLI
jgi:penicillin-binding protein-related factor A (putative recombinase)